MKIFAIAALCLGLSAAGAFAQTASPTPDASATPSTAAPAADAASKPTAKEVRAQCRADAKAQGLTGDAAKQAAHDCFAKALPDLAQRQKCREEGKAKGLEAKELKDYVKTCAAGAQ